MTGRSVLIIGGSSGIGLATALRVAAEGDNLTLMARSPEGLAAAASACRAAGAPGVTVVAGDVARAPDAQSAINSARANYGRLDVVILTATVMSYGTVEQTPPEIFTAVTGVAINGTLYLAQAVLPVMRQQRAGIFIVINSLLGSVTVPEMGAYATAKWGQRALVRTLQQETRNAKNVHVCLVSPGSINTPSYYQAANYTGRATRPPIPVLQSDRTATAIVGLTHRPKAHVSIPVGPPNPLIIAGFRFAPRIYDRLVRPLFALAGHTAAVTVADPGNVEVPRGDRERVHGHWPAPEREL
jgi:NAD(P)-dependent dehydrogenase (short-subunit alcohol dehydrogenase family)